MKNLSVMLAGAMALAAEATMLASVLSLCHRTYRHEYLRLWAWSWRAMAVGNLAAATSLLLLGRLPASEPSRLFLTSVSLVAAYWHGLWLLLGTWEVSGRRPVQGQLHRRALLGLAGIGVVSTLLFAFDPTATTARYVLRVGVKALAVGGAFLAAGAWVLAQAGGGSALGRPMVGWGFVAFGLQQLHHILVGLAVEELEVARRWVALSSFVDLVIPVIVGLGMVLWLLEEEHDRVLKATRALEHLALHDSLTDLPNRTLLQDRLTQALGAAARGENTLAVAVVELDNFRRVNDSFGFRYGDELLRTVAARLLARIRPGDTLARLGGDQFCAVLTGLLPEQAMPTVERLRAGLVRPLRVLEREVEAHTSVGVALYPSHGTTAAELLANALRALQAAKSDPSRLALYDPIRDAAHSQRVRIEAALPRALAAGELSLRYQPIVRLPSGEVAACEALLRWSHPEAGELLPGSFLPAVEAVGLDLEVTEWVLRTAITEFAFLQRAGLQPVELAINLSPRVFQHPAFATLAAAVLAENAFDPAMLQVEITETAAMQDAEAALHALRALKRLGVRIALDDFGTGYSSLSYLRYFPVDVLKIDQSFVRELRAGSGDSAVVESILSLARTLRLAVTAEGVEREEQARWLADHGCDFLQGHFVSPPLTLAQCRSFLAGPQSRIYWSARRIEADSGRGPVLSPSLDAGESGYQAAVRSDSRWRLG